MEKAIDVVISSAVQNNEYLLKRNKEQLIYLESRVIRINKRIEGCKKHIEALEKPELTSLLKERAKRVFDKAAKEGIELKEKIGSSHLFDGTYKKDNVSVQLHCNLNVDCEDGIVSLSCTAVLPISKERYYRQHKEVFRITAGKNFIFKNQVLQFLLESART